MKAVIELENMSFQAFHGCYDLEKVVGNRFLVDLAIEVEAGEAAREDDLSKSVNCGAGADGGRFEYSGECGFADHRRSLCTIPGDHPGDGQGFEARAAARGQDREGLRNSHGVRCKRKVIISC